MSGTKSRGDGGSFATFPDGAHYLLNLLIIGRSSTEGNNPRDHD
jgi:hypothetical protein